jgi:hypothetical protein
MDTSEAVTPEMISRTEARKLQIFNHAVFSGLSTIEIFDHNEVYEPSLEIQEEMEKMREASPLKFDGIAWRFLGSHFDRISGRLRLDVSTGRYSQYRYTNLNPAVRQLSPDPGTWFNGIDMGCVLVTSDNKIYLAKRPKKELSSPDQWDIPCGQPSGLDDEPSNESLSKGISIVADKDAGMELNIQVLFPLLLICEEPTLAHDIIVVAQTMKSSEDIAAESKRELRFVHCGSLELGKFLAAELNLSRPTYLSLTYFGRREFGEEWFSDHTQRKN